MSVTLFVLILNINLHTSIFLITFASAWRIPMPSRCHMKYVFIDCRLFEGSVERHNPFSFPMKCKTLIALSSVESFEEVGHTAAHGLQSFDYLVFAFEVGSVSA